MNYLKVHLTFFSISLFFIANAQITTFDHIDREISSPSLPYETITESADSIFDDWHLQNPNDTGLAPYEKQFFRWRALAESRSHIAGDSSVLIADIGKVMYNKIGSFPYCNTGPTKNPWTLIGPNPEPGDKMIYGIVNCITVDPTDTNIIYSGTQEGGLFKSVDGGQNWTNITDKLNLSGLGVMSIAIDPEHPDTIIVGTYSASFGYTGWLDFSTQGYGIIRSEDGGTSWSTTSLTASQEDGHITVIRFNPANSMTVFAAGSRGIYKSLDNGKTWNQVFSTSTSSTLNNIRFIDLEIALGDTNNICASSIKIGGANTTDSTARVFCSSNGGNTFVNRTPEKVCEYTISGSTTNFNRGAFAIALDVSPADSSNIYAFFASGSSDYGIPKSATLCKTSNAGQNWSEIFDQSGSTASTVLNVFGGRWGRYRYQFELSDSSTDEIYVGGDVMLFYDVNSSTFWSKRSDYWPTKKGHADIRWIHNVGTENGKDILYIANDGGVAKTKNSGADWVSLNGNGFATSQIHGFASWPSNSFYAYGAMHNLQGCIGDGAKKLAQTAPGADGGYTIPEPGSDKYFYTNSNAGLYRSVRNNDNSLSTSKRIDNYYGYFDAKFDAVKTDKVEFYFSGEGVIKVYSPPSPTSTIFNSGTSDVFSVIKVSPSDPDVIYAAMFEACWGCANNGGNVTAKLWKKQKNGTWKDLSSKILKNGSNWQYLSSTYITDITVDPYDTNRVWIGMSYYSPDLDKNRVFHSSDGGNTWQDQSVGLPPYPINCLTYQEGSDDIIYAGTDGGVYYWDKSYNNGSWRCFNNNLPPVIITKIDVQPCRNIVIASTYGRGLWEAPMIESKKAQLSIQSSEYWQSGTTRIFSSDLKVKSGATLTIGGTVKFNPGSKLTIEPGGKVILDGGSLTVNAICEDSKNLWEGVSVLGVSTLNQSSSTHGKLIIRNNGKISHAACAIRNVGWNGTDFDWGTQGGIIDAKDAFFKNNRRDVEFIKYHTYHPTNGTEFNYQAVFDNCTFERNSNYNHSEIPLASITMWEVVGVKFIGCSFSNKLYNGNSHKSAGIYAQSAQFVVDQDPLSSGSSFEGYDYAIWAENMCRADKVIRIKNTSFTDNLFGIYMDVTDGSWVVNNTFDLASDHTSLNGNPSYGVYFDHSTGYTFENNVIEDKKGHGSFGSVGVIFNENGANTNQVYRNTFNGLSIASEAIGINKHVSNFAGLEFKCNNYGNDTENGNDISIYTSSLPGGQGIAAQQGSPNPSASKDLSNNLFSNNDADIYNDAIAYKFNYNHGIGNLKLVPSGTSNYNKNDHTFSVNYSQDCPDQLSSTGNPVDNPFDLWAYAKNANDTLIQLYNKYDQLINGGSTPQLEAEILLAGQTGYTQLYLDLMELSPFVGEPQLIDVIHTGMPELALRNILIANPHSSRDPQVLDALYNRYPAVSQQTINDVLNSAKTITSKDVLERDINFVKLSQNRAARHLQVIYTTDESYLNTDSLSNLFSNLEQSDLVFSWAENLYRTQEYSTLNTWLQNSRPYWDETENNIRIGLQSLYNILSSNLSDGELLDSLSSSQISAMVALRTNSIPYISHKVNAHLAGTASYEQSYTEPVYLSGASKRDLNESTQRPATPETSFKLWPNPTDKMLTLQWDWMEEGLKFPLEINIYTIDGKQILTHTVEDYMKNIQVFNVQSWKKGSYVIQIRSNNMLLFSEIFQKK